MRLRVPERAVELCCSSVESLPIADQDKAAPGAANRSACSLRPGVVRRGSAGYPCWRLGAVAPLAFKEPGSMHQVEAKGSAGAIDLGVRGDLASGVGCVGCELGQGRGRGCEQGFEGVGLEGAGPEDRARGEFVAEDEAWAGDGGVGEQGAGV